MEMLDPSSIIISRTWSTQHIRKTHHAWCIYVRRQFQARSCQSKGRSIGFKINLQHPMITHILTQTEQRPLLSYRWHQQGHLLEDCLPGPWSKHCQKSLLELCCVNHTRPRMAGSDETTRACSSGRRCSTPRQNTSQNTTPERSQSHAIFRNHNN